MKTTVTFSFAILLSTCLAVTSFAEESTAKTEAKPAATSKQNPAGTWRLEYDFGGIPINDAFQLNLGKENELLGTLYRNDSKLKIQDGKFDDNAISFTVTTEYEGTEWVTKYAGKVDGDSLQGTAGEIPFTAKRKASESASQK